MDTSGGYLIFEIWFSQLRDAIRKRCPKCLKCGAFLHYPEGYCFECGAKLNWFKYKQTPGGLKIKGEI